MEKQKLAIVGIFFDGYVDSWIDFLRCFKKNWPDCPYSLNIITNTKRLEEYGDVNWITAGENAEYSKKVQTAIEQINADYFLLMLEDFYIGQKLDGSILEPILDYIYEEDLDYYSLSELSAFRKYKSKLYDPQKKYLYRINPKYRYTLGCQAVIWKRDFLSKCIGTRNYNAWVFEGALAKSKVTHSSDFLCKCVKDTRNVLRLKHGILQQKLLPPTVEYFKSIGDPLTSRREIMSDKQYKKYVRNSRISSAIPKPIYRVLKKLLGKRRGSAVLDKYESEIQLVIAENFGA